MTQKNPDWDIPRFGIFGRFRFVEHTSGYDSIIYAILATSVTVIPFRPRKMSRLRDLVINLRPLHWAQNGCDRSTCGHFIRNVCTFLTTVRGQFKKLVQAQYSVDPNCNTVV